MPLRGSYDVKRVEGGETPRSTSLFTGGCMLRLLGFFVFCILVLIVCLVRWGPRDQPESTEFLLTEKQTRDKQGNPNNTAGNPSAPYTSVVGTVFNPASTTDPLNNPSDNEPLSNGPTLISSSGINTSVPLNTPSSNEPSSTGPTLISSSSINTSVPLTTPSSNEPSGTGPTLISSSSMNTSVPLTAPSNNETLGTGPTLISSSGINTSVPLTTPSSNEPSGTVPTLISSSSINTSVPLTTPSSNEPSGTGTTLISSSSINTSVPLTTPSSNEPSGTGPTLIASSSINTSVPLTTPSSNEPSGTVPTLISSSSINTSVPLTTPSSNEPSGTGTTLISSSSINTSVPLTTPSSNEPSGTGPTLIASSSINTSVPLTTPSSNEPSGTGPTLIASSSINTSVPLTTPSSNEPSGTVPTLISSSSINTSVPLTTPSSNEPSGTGTTLISSSSINTSVPLTTPSSNEPSGTGPTLIASSSINTSVPLTTPSSNEPSGTGTTLISSSSINTSVPLTTPSSNEPSGTGPTLIASSTINTSVPLTNPSSNEPSGTGTTLISSSSINTSVPSTTPSSNEPSGTGTTLISPSSRNTTNASISTDSSHKSSTKSDQNENFGRHVASQMVFYINHSADACEDFYEHACGRFETNHLMTENDLSKQAAQRIFDQAKMKSTTDQGSEFQDYYQSCVTYHKNSNESYMIESAKKAISEVGEFYGEGERRVDYLNLTAMLSQLFLRNSAPLFDITADVKVDGQVDCEDQGRATDFTWKLGPPVLESNSYREKKEHDCYNALTSAMLEDQVNLHELHENYTNCKNDLPKFLDSVQEAMKLSGLSADDIQNARYEIEINVMQVFHRLHPDTAKKSRNNPTEGEIRNAYLTKNYKLMKIEDLQKELSANDQFLDWKQLLTTLKGSPVDLEQPLQVYFSDVILKGLNTLHEESDPKDLHNALLGLYAHKVYYEFVVPPPDVETHCKRVATSLMGTHASSLYMSSFSSQELADMKETVTEVFDDLKKTLESGLMNASWLDQTGEKEIVSKIRDLTIEIPDVSYYQNDQKLNPERSLAKKNLHLTGKFFDDTMMLQNNYRKSMYEALDKSPSDYDQIWTHFGLPYQTKGSAIHGLNKIVMPYGGIDWSVVSSAKKISSRHLVLATLGTRIAELIAHHFDSTGVQYFAGRKHKEYLPVFCTNEDAANTYRAYVDDTKLFFEGFKDLFLSSTKQHVSYSMTDISLDERLSATTGLQLAYDTMSRLPSESKKLLPWLTNDPTDEAKQFFLAYAQMHCTKVPLTSSFVSLNEKEDLPSRLRVLAAASSNKVLGKTWECRTGSPLCPEHVPSQFLHLEKLEEDNGQQTTL